MSFLQQVQTPLHPKWHMVAQEHLPNNLLHDLGTSSNGEGATATRKPYFTPNITPLQFSRTPMFIIAKSPNTHVRYHQESGHTLSHEHMNAQTRTHADRHEHRHTNTRTHTPSNFTRDDFKTTEPP